MSADKCRIFSTMCYMNRLYHMPADTIAKHVYEETNRLHSTGFITWVTRVNELIVKYDMDITKLLSNFRTECKTAVIMQFKNQWGIDIHNIETHPILRTYNKFKCFYGIEPYLNMLKSHKCRTAVSQFRTSSHTLAIERGRHSRPKVHISDRTCNICGVLEDETHFLIHCSLYRREREALFCWPKLYEYKCQSHISTAYWRNNSNIRRVKSPNWNISRFVLQLSLPNQMKPGVIPRIKM